uniref:Uncharacterized protein n=1 Tax=Romanomermis culicivorax TaxID=13658 RepID=A0A915IM90_ROMCU
PKRVAADSKVHPPTTDLVSLNDKKTSGFSWKSSISSSVWLAKKYQLMVSRKMRYTIKFGLQTLSAEAEMRLMPLYSSLFQVKCSSSHS